MSKSTINRRRKEGESTRAAAMRLAQETPPNVGSIAAKTWLDNKKQKSVKKVAPPKKTAEAPINNTPVRGKKR